MADRRIPEERRNRSDRRRFKKRRQVDEQFAVIEIATTDLRVVILNRNSEDSADKVQMAVVPWRNDATSLNSEAGKKELSRALRELCQEYHLQTSQVRFVLGGALCVTKAIRGTTEEVRNELQQIKQRSRLYLMLGPGEKVSVSSSRSIDARHEYAIAATCNQKTLETIHSAANFAGIKIESIEPALVSISRIIERLKEAPTEPCLIIHLDKNTSELGICHEGQLLLDYRPGGLTDSRDLVELVQTHLSRLQRHVGRQLREAPPKLKKIYLCGEKEAVDSAYPAFAACEEFEVQRIDPAGIQATWEFENDVIGSASVPALGTLLSTYLPEEECHTPNFMEHILASTRVPLGPILIRSAIPLAAVLLVACGFLLANNREQAAASDLEQRVERLLPAQGRARELRLRLISADAKLTQLNRMAEKVHSLPANEVLGWVGHCMPSDVWLSKLAMDGGRTIKLDGVSYLETGVFDFVRWLEQSPHFSDVALRSTRPAQSPSGPAINFDVELKFADLETPVKEVARNE
ncbi:MAG: PilN domain-containing protein [Planctomycetes bacterium]|nr:PilN domain-containing protein [Planctomycetota bacterium]